MVKGINLIFIQNDKVLLVTEKGEDFWTFPGGELEKGESDSECLEREIREELSARVSIENFYHSFSGRTSYTNKPLEIRAYFGYIAGKITPSSEIRDARFFSDFRTYKLSDITKNIINSLKQNRYLKNGL